MNGRRIVITGLGVMTAVGSDAKTFWQSLLAGQSGVDRIHTFDIAHYDSQIAAEVRGFNAALFFKSPKDVRRTDRYAHLAVAAAKEAVADTALDLNTENRDLIGVIIGSGIGGLATLESGHKTLLTKGPSRMSPFIIPALISNMASGIVSMEYGLRGPNFATVSACATSAHAIGESARLILCGDADVMVAGGSEAAITPVGIGAFCAMKALSTRNDAPSKASRPFDKERDGFVMGEGAGICVLEELQHAKKRGAKIYCEIVGYAANADAFHMSTPAPGGAGAARCMQLALAKARLRPEEVQYINAHGTSTQVGDACETQAIKTVFGAYAKRLAVSSTKSMTGHLLGAAGAVETIVCAQAIQSGKVPPTINYEFPDPVCDLDYVPNTARELNVTVALNNSFGFGGHNATLVLKKFV